MNFKNLWPQVAVTLVALTGIANAAPTGTAPSTTNSGLTDSATTLAKTKQRGIFSLDADLLIWKAKADGLDFALTDGAALGTAPAPASVSLTKFNLSENSVKGKWRPGLRVGAYYHSQHDDFDFRFDWTWFQMKGSHATSTVTGAKAGELISTLTPEQFYNPQNQALYAGTWNPVVGPAAFATGATTAAITTALDSATAQWGVKSNWFDLNVGRVYKPGTQWLSLRPHAGLRYVALHQTFDASYHHGNVAAAPSGGSAPAVNVKESNARASHLHGIGLRGGVDTVWAFSDEWAGYANFAATALFSRFHSTFSHTVPQSGAAITAAPVLIPVALDASFDGKHHALKGMADMDIGVMWKRIFNNNIGVTVALGWEHHVLFGAQQLGRFTNFNGVTGTSQFARSGGDLGFNGLKISGKFDF